MRKLILFCLLFTQMHKAYADKEYLNSELISKRASLCESNESKEQDIIKYLTQNNPRIYSELEWNDIKIPAPRPGLLRLINLLFSEEHKDGVTYTSESVIEKYPQVKNCKHEICIVQKIFGEKEGPYYLYFLHKYKFNISPYATKIYSSDIYNGRSRFKLNELKDIDHALSILPKNVFRHYDINTQFKKINHYNNNTIANSTLSFFSIFSDLSSHERIGTVIHELGHNIAEKIAKDALDEEKKWTSFSWDISKGVYEAERLNDNQEFVSWYAKHNPVEDFAENFTAYVLNPSFMKKIDAKKYDFMKRFVFGGIEYTTDKKCYISNNVSDVSSKSNGVRCIDDFITSIKNADSRDVNKCFIEKRNDLKNVPLNIDVENLNEILSEDEIKGMQEEILEEFVTKAFKAPMECQGRYPSFAFETGKELMDNGYILYFMATDLCRWARTGVGLRNVEESEKTLRSSLKDILRQRVFRD